MPWPEYWDEWSLTERNLWIDADEGSDLWYLPGPELDHRPDGTTFEWPAKDPNECSRILGDWLAEGFIQVFRYVRFGGNEVSVEYLPDEEAGELLRNPSHWDHQRFLALTDLGVEMVPRRRE